MAAVHGHIFTVWTVAGSLRHDLASLFSLGESLTLQAGETQHICCHGKPWADGVAGGMGHRRDMSDNRQIYSAVVGVAWWARQPPAWPSLAIQTMHIPSTSLDPAGRIGRQATRWAQACQASILAGTYFSEPFSGAH